MFDFCEKTKKESYRDLYIDRYGYVYPSCRTYEDTVIGNLADEDIYQKVMEARRELDTIQDVHERCQTEFDLVTVEFSSFCRASCIYCFQNNAAPVVRYPFYEQLMDFLSKIRMRELFTAGGEILDQPDTMAFLEQYRATFPDQWIHLKTNGCSDKVDFVTRIFNSVMVSVNGFSQASYQTLMHLEDMETMKAFCKEVSESGKTDLLVKLLVSPLDIHEMADFFNWGVSLSPKSIIYQAAYEYSYGANGQCSRRRTFLEDLKGGFWEEVIRRSNRRLEKSIRHYQADHADQKTVFFADKEVTDFLNFNPFLKDFFSTSGTYSL